MKRSSYLTLVVLVLPLIICIACTTQQPPIINSFTANPSSLSAGACSVLDWNVSGASTVNINPGVGTVPATSSTQVCPAGTLTYTLTANNAAGSGTRMVTVTVAPPPQVQKPNIVAGATIPQNRINFNQLFRLGIIVFNTGDVPAQNAHLYCKANPGGLITVQGVDQPTTPLAPSGVNVDLGDISPGSQRNVNLYLKAPTQAALDGLNGQNFEISFAADYDGGAQSPVGSITFSVGQGMMMMTPSGFSQ